MKIIQFSVTTICLLIASQLHSQELVIEWENTIGGNSFDNLISVLETSDGGYILGGGSRSDASDDKSENSIGIKDYWAVKIDETGTVVWETTVGGTGSDYLEPIAETADGGYVLAGTSLSGVSGNKSEDLMGLTDFWIIKLDSDGEVIWENTIGGFGEESLISIHQTTDNGFILGGYSNSNISADKTENSIGEYDFWLVKVNEFGEVLWDKTIGGNGPDLMRSLSLTDDGGFAIVGASLSDASGNKTEDAIGGSDYWFVRTDNLGNVILDKTIGGNGGDEPTEILQTAEGGYIISGYSDSDISGDKSQNSFGSLDYWVVKINQVGIVEWDRTLGGDQLDRGDAITIVNDTDYLVGGSAGSSISGNKTTVGLGLEDYWIVMLGTEGDIQWQASFGGEQTDFLYDLQQTSDGGYLLGGWSDSDVSDDKSENSLGEHDYWVIKLLDCGIIDSTITVDGTTLTSNAEGYTYQWINCDDDNTPIDGATDQSYSPEINGNYAVIISDGPCEIISDCYSIVSVGLSNNEFENILKIYPNPTTGILYIDYDKPLTVKIISLLGEVVFEYNQNEISLEDLSDGMYLIKAYDKDLTLIGTNRIIKK